MKTYDDYFSKKNYSRHFWTTKISVQSVYGQKLEGFEPSSHDFFFRRRFAISSSADGSKFVVVVIRKWPSHRCRASKPWPRCTSWTSCATWICQQRHFVVKTLDLFEALIWTEFGKSRFVFVGHGRIFSLSSFFVVIVVGSHFGRFSRSQLGKYWERRGKILLRDSPTVTVAEHTHTHTRALARLIRLLSLSLSTPYWLTTLTPTHTVACCVHRHALTYQFSILHHET